MVKSADFENKSSLHIEFIVKKITPYCFIVEDVFSNSSGKASKNHWICDHDHTPQGSGGGGSAVGDPTLLGFFSMFQTKLLGSI